MSDHEWMASPLPLFRSETEWRQLSIDNPVIRASLSGVNQRNRRVVPAYEHLLFESISSEKEL